MEDGASGAAEASVQAGTTGTTISQIRRRLSPRDAGAVRRAGRALRARLTDPHLPLWRLPPVGEDCEHGVVARYPGGLLGYVPRFTGDEVNPLVHSGSVPQASSSHHQETKQFAGFTPPTPRQREREVQAGV